MRRTFVESLGYRQGRVGMDCRHTSVTEYVRGWTVGNREWRTTQWALKRKLDKMSSPR